MNFSTESANESTIYHLLFLIAIYSPKNDNLSIPLKMRNWHHSSDFTITKVFPGLRPILTSGLKY